jgi:RNA methyltransferase, TrmH family
MQKYKPYKKDSDYSYSIGIFPTIELLQRRPEQIETIFVAPGSDHSAGVQKIRGLCQQHNVTLVESEKDMIRLARADHVYALGVFKKYVTPLVSGEPHVVLVNPDNAGNLGTIIRTMVGFDHVNLAIIRPSTDAFAPKVVRASMGAIFNVNIEYFDDIGDYTARFAHYIYPFLLETRTKLGDVTFKSPHTLVFGNEGSGLPAEYDHLGTPVRIEQNDRVDSLNLAVATSVALYHAYTNNHK